jgi:tetratricopeptide (TPR) repeat protein
VSGGLQIAMRQSAMKSKSVPPQTWKIVLFSGLFLGLMLVVYWPALHGGFIWDDDAYVTNNPLLTAPDGWQRIWFSAHRQSQFFPLVFTTLRLEHALWGLNPFGYHLVNVLMHAANTLLLWVVLKRLAVPGAWIAAALFAFHPVQVESVAWVTELKNTQSTLFYLLALLMWIRFLRPEPAPHRRYYWLSLLFYVPALLSKTTVCTLPAALLLVPWMQGEQINWRRMLQVVPFVVLGVAAGLVSIWWEAHLGNYRENVGQSLSWLQRMLIASHALWFYAGKLAWPVNLCFSYPHWRVSVSDPANYVWVASFVIVAFGLWRWRRTAGRRVIGAVIFFVATLSPLLGFIPLYTFRYSYVADHYQYVAGIGLLALAAAGLSRMPRLVTIVLLAALGVLTWKQAKIYRDPTTLWQNTLAKNPDSWMAHNNLGLIFKSEGKLDQAAHQYEQAILLKPGFAQGHYNLGIALFKQGHTDEAITEIQQAIRLEPCDSRAYYNYAIALGGTGHTDEAVKQYEEAIRLDPDYVDAHINLGIMLSQQGKIDEALAQFTEAARLAPDDAEAHNNLGAVLRAKGRLNEAIGQFQEAIRLNPSHDLAHANLGLVLLKQGRTDEALQQFQAALQLNPENAEARTGLAAALATKAASDGTSSPNHQ